jgi:glycosyltransferase involved in cell wall biosynthesis
VEFKKRGSNSDVIVLDERGARERILVEAGVGIYDFGATLKSDYQLIIAHTNSHDPRVNEIVASVRTTNCTTVNVNVFGWPIYNARKPFDFHAHISYASRWRCLARGRWLGLEPSRHLVAYYSVDTSHFRLPSDLERKTARAIIGLTEELLVWLRVGQPIAAKWDPLLIHAFELASQKNDQVRLVLVGAPPNILEAVARLPALSRERILVAPPTGDEFLLRNYYWSADVFCHSARIGESFGMVLLESMLCGTPVFTRVAPGRDFAQAEFITDGFNGRVVFGKQGFVTDLAALTPSSISELRAGCHTLRSALASWVSIPSSVDMLLNAANRHESKQLVPSNGLPRRNYDEYFREQSMKFRIVNWFLNTSVAYLGKRVFWFLRQQSKGPFRSHRQIGQK